MLPFPAPGLRIRGAGLSGWSLAASAWILFACWISCLGPRSQVDWWAPATATTAADTADDSVAFIQTSVMISKDIRIRGGSTHESLPNGSLRLSVPEIADPNDLLPLPADMENNANYSSKSDEPNVEPKEMHFWNKGMAVFAIWTLLLCVLGYLGIVILKIRYAGSTDTLDEYLNGVWCFVCYSVCALLYGVFQEYMTYVVSFPSASFMIMGCRVMTFAIGIAVTIILQEEIYSKTSLFVAIPAASMFFAAYAQYRALYYVSFPTTVGMKSAMIVATMLLNTLILGKKHGWVDYGFAVFIAACVSCFTLVMESSNNDVVNTDTTEVGVLLMIVFLFFEALASIIDKMIFSKSKIFCAVNMLTADGFFSGLYAFITLLMGSGLSESFNFLTNYPHVIIPFAGLAIFSASSQYVLFYTVRRHGPVALSIMMTLKQFLAMMLSAAIYDHEITAMAYMLAILAFAALLVKPILEPAALPDKCTEHFPPPRGLQNGPSKPGSPESS